MVKPEFLVQHIHVDTQGIDLLNWLENSHWSLRGKLSLVQVKFAEGTLTREHLGELANRAFDIRPLKAEEISENFQILADGDFAFATEFGFTLIPHFASLHQTADGAIEAWISPVLLPQNHPLADSASNGVALFTDSNPTHRFITERVREFDELTLGRYIRLTVDDQPLVLASTLVAFPEEGINIHEVKQPEPEKGVPTAQLAILLNPCSGLSFGRALNAIRALPSCRAINTVLPVIDLGRWGMLQNEKA